MVIIFSEHITNRLDYVLNFVFKSKGVDYIVTKSLETFNQSRFIKINYSNLDLKANKQICPHGLLFKSEIEELSDLKFDKNKWFIDGLVDEFSIIFYFLSRYEEYVIEARDEHDRFSSKQSFITKNNRLDKPNVDLIVKGIFQDIGLDYSSIQDQFKMVLSFDIDSAWAFKNKGVVRSFLSDMKDLSKGKNVIQKIRVRRGFKKDPFDTFDYIKDLSENYEVICFFLLGDWGKYDKNISWKNGHFKKLIQEITEYSQVGIHPSYQSYLKPEIVKKEIERLEVMAGKKVEKSRQHFLKLKIPQTYQQLIKLGIKVDYSMGFADGYGFRAGTSFPFNFFDCELNQETDLLVYPITYMDGTLNEYFNLSKDEAKQVVERLKAEVKSVGGLFVPLWHNETIGETGKWEGWLDVFESNLK